MSYKKNLGIDLDFCFPPHAKLEHCDMEMVIFSFSQLGIRL